MKTLMIIALFTALTLTGFGQNTDVKNLLKDKETRAEIFNTIAMNPELKKEFMATMKMHQGHMSMQKGNETKMKAKGQMEMKEESPDASMMMNSPEKRDQMMTKMMEMCKNNPDMQKMMADKMTKNPEMMQTMMKMMKEKGMMDKNGCMKMKPGSMKMGSSDAGTGKQEHKH